MQAVGWALMTFAIVLQIVYMAGSAVWEVAASVPYTTLQVSIAFAALALTGVVLAGLARER